VGSNSIKYRKEIEHLPTPDIPIMNIAAVVTSIFVLKKKMIIEAVCNAIEKRKTFFLP
jgi:hypothetical protein